MFVKRTKFVCQLFPNMKVGDKIQFLGGEFIATTSEQVETLRNMKSVVKEVVEKEPEPAKVEVTEEEVEEFKVPARWDKKRIKSEATKHGVKFPDDEMLKPDMVSFLEDAVNTKEDEE